MNGISKLKSCVVVINDSPTKKKTMCSNFSQH